MCVNIKLCKYRGVPLLSYYCIKLNERRNTRVLGSIDWNRQPFKYDIPSHSQASNPPVQAPNSSAPSSPEPNPLASNPQVISNGAKIILLEADIGDLQIKIYKHEAAIHRLRAEICVKEGQIK